MKKYINLDDRLFSQIEEYCSLNKIKLQDYLCICIQNQFYIDKYGDMNKLTQSAVIEKECKEDDDTFILNIEEIIINKDKKQVKLIDIQNKNYDFDFNKIKIIEENLNLNKEIEKIDNTDEIQTTRVTKRQLKTK